MTDPRRWLLAAPASGGTCHLELHGDRVRHLYEGLAAGASGEGAEGPAEEWLCEFLARGRDPRGLADERLGPVIAEIRRSLDGVYRVDRSSYARLRVDHGQPIELSGPIYCDDPGRGGHGCTFGCAGRVTYESSLPQAEALVGEPLVFTADWDCRGDGESFAPLRRFRDVATTGSA